MQKHALFLILFLVYNFVLCENQTNNTKKSRGTLTVGYLRGYKLGQALKIPAFLISPIIIVPKIKQENNANLSSEEELQENSVIFQKIIPVRIILNDKKLREENNDIEVNFRQALNRGSKSDINENKTNVTTKQSDDIMVVDNTLRNATRENITTTTDTTTTEEYHPQENITELPKSTESSGPYPTAVYNDQVVNTLSITDGPPNFFLLPPLLDEEWKNFTAITNLNVSKENNTEPSTNSDNVTLSPLVNKTDSTIKGPYPAALYHNVEIDQLSITTNSYTNESPLPPPRDDRWRSFSSLREMLSTSNQFRPLAGLYYDGFLHRPLPMKPGFVPYNQYTVYEA